MNIQMLATIPNQIQPQSVVNPKSRAKKKFNLAGLPNEILLTVFDNLDVFDSAALALTCKRVAGLAVAFSQLDIPRQIQEASPTVKPYAINDFTKKHLKDGYFSKRLKYCWNCKHYVPRRMSHWKKKLSRKGWRGWLLTNKPWVFSDWWDAPKTKKILHEWNKGKAFTCPRCKLCKALDVPVV
jgi:F-box-like